MRSVAVMLLFGAVMFGASAAGSFYVQSHTPKKPKETAAEVLMPGPTGEGDGESPAIEEDLPVAVRPKPMSVEEILRVGMGLKSREKTLDEREASLKKQESRLQLVLADVRGEQQQIEGLQAQVRDQTTAAESLLQRINEARQALATERQKAQEQLETFKETQIEYQDQERENVKRMSQWFQGMEPEKAAEMLKELANDGKLELAVQLLSNFEDRDAAKVLSAVDDNKLVVELTERFKDLKRPERGQRRR